MDGHAETLRQRVVAAYGGEAAWRAATTVEATVSCGGLLFRWKRGRAGGFRRLSAQAAVAEPRIRLAPFDRQGHVGMLEGHDVRLEDLSGRVIAARRDARAPFPSGRRLLWWDRLDMVYFLGYALWNYLVLPALLLRDDITWCQLTPGTLEATFPSHLPTHCPRAQFHFDPATGLLRQYDYTAEVFGQWAHAAHLVTAHAWQGRLPYTAKRRVRPLLASGRVLPAPTLIWADVHDFRLE
jgi:hypothetical protein